MPARAIRLAACVLLAWSAAAGSGRAATLQLAWDPSPDPNVVGYKVSFGTHSGVYTTQLDAGAQTSELVPSLAAGATYYFVVQGYDGAGNLSSPSNELAATTPTVTPLSITCPAPTATSATGAPVAVAFSSTISGGSAPVNSSCTPASGSLFAVGSTSVQCSASDALKAVASCATTVYVASSVNSSSSTTTTTAPPPAPPPTSVDIVGAISRVSGKCPSVSFRIGTTSISASKATTYDKRSCPSLSNNRVVEVKGTKQSNGTVTAQTITINR